MGARRALTLARCRGRVRRHSAQVELVRQFDIEKVIFSG